MDNNAPLQPPARRTCIIEVRLGKCLTGPTKRMARDLHDAARACNQARNAIVKQWELWHWQRPDYEPAQMHDKTGLPLVRVKHGGKTTLLVDDGGKYRTRRGKSVSVPEDAEISPATEHRFFPQTLIDSWAADSLYSTAKRIAPQIAGKLLSSLVQEVKDDLSAKMPWSHDGQARRKYEAIVNCEISRQTYRQPLIPVPSQDIVIAWNGALSRKLTEKSRVKQHILAAGGNGQCVVRFPIFSRESGRKQQSIICRVEVRQLDKRRRSKRSERSRSAILRRIVAGEWPLRDSHLVYKRKAWFLQIVTVLPQRMAKLNQGVVADLMPCPLQRWRPFRLTCGEDMLDVGHAQHYAHEYARLVKRRKTLQARYKTGMAKGHGKQHFFRTFTRWERATRDMQSVYLWRLANAAADYCVQHEAGKLVWREPSLGLRKQDWFSMHGVPLDWTDLRAKLEHVCGRIGIELFVERMQLKEYCERFGAVEIPETARELEAQTDRWVADIAIEPGTGKRGHHAAPLATGPANRDGSMGYVDPVATRKGKPG